MSFVQKTLPVRLSAGLDLGVDDAAIFGGDLTSVYSGSEPFPHVVIDDFLPLELIEKIRLGFPSVETADEMTYLRGYKGQNKRQINPNQCNLELRAIFSFFNSAAFLQFLEKMTGIDGLIPDPYFTGGGLHETTTGGYLGVHSDFRVNKKLHVERRLNAIIYLNKDWREEYGGNLELWDVAMKNCLRKISPLYNRCVVFNTDKDSNHGHPEPLATPDGISRRSVALYYYTASNKIYDDIPVNKTHYKPRPKERSSLKYYANKWFKRKS